MRNSIIVPSGSGNRLGADLKSYIRIYTTDTSDSAASIFAEYYEDGELKDSKTIPYTNPGGVFHYIAVAYLGSGANAWIITPASGQTVFKATVSENKAVFSSDTPFLYDQWSYKMESNNVYGQPNLNWEKNPVIINL